MLASSTRSSPSDSGGIVRLRLARAKRRYADDCLAPRVVFGYAVANESCHRVGLEGAALSTKEADVSTEERT